MIIFTILKIIGVILLSIVLLVLSILFILLFWPIRYKGSIVVKDKKPYGKINVSFFFKILSFTIELINNEPTTSFKIFGIKKGKKKQTSKIKKSKSNKPQKVKKNENKKKEIQLVEKPKKVKNTNQKSASNKTKPKKEKIKFKILSIYDKLLSIKGKFDSYYEFLTSESSIRAVYILKLRGFKLLKHILPRKLKGKVYYGMKDPYTTGLIYGGITMFYGIYGKTLILYPDFETEDTIIPHGNVKFRGRIHIGYIIYQAFRVYRIPRVREFIKFIKKS